MTRPRLPDGAALAFWAESYVARVNGARAFLSALGMPPFREDREALVPEWRVTGWRGRFSNEELVALAEQQGFRA